MSTDRELLERAAKAAGLTDQLKWWEGRFIWDSQNAYVIKEWNPLAHDGDALRLAVHLNICITPYPIYEHPKHSVIADVKAHAECPNAQPPLRYCERCTDPCQLKRQVAETQPHGADPYAATRRAIVRAAAAIGEKT